jgi:hypothetical protein
MRQISLRTGRVHYAWIVAAVTFFVLVVTAAVRAMPGVLMVPLENEFGWSAAAISGAIAINIALFGLIGPFAASLILETDLRTIESGQVAGKVGNVERERGYWRSP